MISILHIIHDDKFFDGLIRIFDNTDYSSKYVVVFRSEDISYRYIKNTARVEGVLKDSTRYWELLKAEYDLIAVHYLDGKEDIVRDIKRGAHLLWIAWGGDFYHRIDFDLYQEATAKALDAIESKLHIAKTRSLLDIPRIIYRRLISQNIRSLVTRSTVNRFDYCSTVIPPEFELIKKVGGFRARQVYFNYPFDVDINSIDFSRCGNSILVGNSRTWENNHLDIFARLRDCLRGDRDIICPMSYGVPIDKFRSVLDFGEVCFENHFIPVLDYMDLERYNAILSRCSVAIFNHYRQQGVGNIILMLLRGAKVFLSNRNPVLAYLRSQGVAVYSIESDLNNESLLTPMSDSKIMSNRDRVGDLYSDRRLLTNIGLMIETICGTHHTEKLKSHGESASIS